MKRVLFPPLVCSLLFSVLCFTLFQPAWSKTLTTGPVLIIDIEGAITPAKKEYLRSSLKVAERKQARLFVLRLNTPGGLLNSMQEMVADLLEAKVPTVVYVTPSGGGAISAGVFITLAGHFAYMAPGTNIGAAHPVTGGGKDIEGDMRAKLENYAASLVRAIADKHGRNAEWAEKAVRESVALTAKEAFAENVIDGLAADLPKLLSEIEGKTVTVDGQPVSIAGLSEAPQEVLQMSFRQRAIDLLCNPNIALLFGFFAMLLIWFELYAPGGFVAGTIGVICLVLSLIAGQALPFNEGGVILLVLAFGFFVAEMIVPAFGFWGIAGIVCLILGSIYFIDTDEVWSARGFTVSKLFVAAAATVMCTVMGTVAYAVFRSAGVNLNKKRDKLVGKTATVKSAFAGVQGSDHIYGKVLFEGRELSAQFTVADTQLPQEGSTVKIVDIEQSGRSVIVEPQT